MSGTDAVGGPSASHAPLTVDQKSALKRLDQAATQLEGVFLEMMMSEMSKTVSHDSIYGKESMTEDVFSGMLDNQRAQAMAQNGGLGIAKAIEGQLRDAVLSDAATEAHTNVQDEVGP